jgi:hypothetical protein
VRFYNPLAAFTRAITQCVFSLLGSFTRAITQCIFSQLGLLTRAITQCVFSLLGSFTRAIPQCVFTVYLVHLHVRFRSAFLHHIRYIYKADLAPKNAKLMVLSNFKCELITVHKRNAKSDCQNGCVSRPLDLQA